MNDNRTGRKARHLRPPCRKPARVLLTCALMAGCGGEAQIPLPNAAVVVAAPTDHLPAPPRIAAQPQPQIVGDGATAVFSVRVEGRGPFAYQWLREGVEIAGARGPTLVIAAVQRADDGTRFRVVVRGAEGVAASEPVRLGVEPAGFHAPWSL